jgi:ketosteroid isomerase-like protein
MKSSGLIILVFLGLTGCDSSADRNKNIALEFFDAFNRHDWNKMASYYSPTAEFLDPSFGKEYVTRSRDQTSAKYTEMQAMFPDIYDDVKEVYEDGDKVIVEFVSSGSSGDSIHFKLPIISVLTFRDGTIIRDATYYDQ